jgi:hypothetical protein
VYAVPAVSLLVNNAAPNGVYQVYHAAPWASWHGLPVSPTSPAGLDHFRDTRGHISSGVKYLSKNTFNYYLRSLGGYLYCTVYVFDNFNFYSTTFL